LHSIHATREIRTWISVAAGSSEDSEHWRVGLCSSCAFFCLLPAAYCLLDDTSGLRHDARSLLIVGGGDGEMATPFVGGVGIIGAKVGSARFLSLKRRFDHQSGDGQHVLQFPAGRSIDLPAEHVLTPKRDAFPGL